MRRFRIRQLPPVSSPRKFSSFRRTSPLPVVRRPMPRSAARVQALEEEVVARDRAVKESNDRVAKLEKQIKDLQSLLELKSKGMADLQKPAATPSAPTQTPAQKPSQAVTPPPAPPAAEVKPATPVPAPTTPAPPAPTTENGPAPSQPTPVQPKPAPVRPAAVPAPAPSLMDQVLDQPAYLGAGIGLLIIIGALAVRAVKRRRESKSDAEEAGPARASADNPEFAYAADAPVAAAKAAMRGPKRQEKASDEVDPVAEAEIFLAYGRDAQAEELLKEALERSPQPSRNLFEAAADLRQSKGRQIIRESGPRSATGYGWFRARSGNRRSSLATRSTRTMRVTPQANPPPASDAGSSCCGRRWRGERRFQHRIRGLQPPRPRPISTWANPAAPSKEPRVIDLAAGPAHDDTIAFERQQVPAMDFNVDVPAAELPASQAAAAQRPVRRVLISTST